MRRISRWAAVAMGLALMACGDSSGPDEDQTTITGTFTLQTINGNPLPFTLAEFEGFKFEILSDVFTFNADRTFRDISTTRETDEGEVTTSTDTINGTYNLTNTTLMLTSSEGESLTATLSAGNNTMTAVGQGFTFVYRK